MQVKNGPKVGKIIFASTLFKPNKGGIENSIYELSKIAVEEGLDTYIVCSNKNNVDNTELAASDNINGATVLRYEYGSGISSILKQLYSSFSLFKELKAECIDLVIVRSFLLVLTARLAGFKNIRYLVPSVVYAQQKKSKTSKYTFKIYFDILMQYLAFRLSKVFVFSEVTKQQVFTASLKKVVAEVVSPGLDLSRFKRVNENERLRLKSKLGLPKNKIIILCLGRFTSVKNFLLPIEAMSFLPDIYHLVLVGDGPEKNSYIKKIQDLNLKGRVSLFPFTDAPEHYFKCSDIFCMVSSYETFGQVLLEATASGCKIVAFPNTAGVETAVEEIYKGYPTLVQYVQSEKLDAYKFSQAVVVCEEGFESEYYSDLSRFLNNYSWFSLFEKITY